MERYVRRRCLGHGFTLIELLVVLSILGLLTALVAPRYFGALERGKEQAMSTSLSVMREAIDRFAADKGRYPASLQELADARYIRAVPEDSITGRRDTWQEQPPPADSHISGGVADVRSGALGTARDGTHFSSW